MKRLILPCLLMMLASFAQASSYRYSFDVVESDLHFQFITGPDGNFVMRDDPLYDRFASGFHTLGFLAGRVGSVVLEAASPTSVDGISKLTCVSGFLCDGTTGRLHRSFSDMALAGVDGMVSAPPFAVNMWRLAENSLTFYEDAQVSIFGMMDGGLYNGFAPQASFTLANTETRIIPNPLPPAALLLGAGLIPLAVLRRRRNRV